jgi:hypothetical protein
VYEVDWNDHREDKDNHHKIVLWYPNIKVLMNENSELMDHQNLIEHNFYTMILYNTWFICKNNILIFVQNVNFI